MAENRNSSNNGHSPFRRYVPPASNGHRTQTGQVTPFPHRPRSSPQTRSSPQNHQPPLSESSRRSRSVRNRWRQWVNASTPPNVSGEPRQPPQPASAQPPSAQPRPPRQPPTQAGDSKPSAPLEGVQTPWPHPSLPRPTAFTQHSPGQPIQGGRGRPVKVPPPGQSPRPGVGAPSRQQPSPVSNKVTPLRRQPRRPASSEETVIKGLPRRDRHSPRRRSRQAPRPVLYGIRLLIVGTGIAAITGTILSTLNPGREAAVSESLGQGAAVTTPQPGRRNSSASALSAPLPLAEELAYLETDLVALEAMTPGLTQFVFFYDLDTGNYVDLNGTSAVSAASTIKMPILVAFLEAVDAGTVQLNQAITLREDMIAGGSGEMQTHEMGRQYTALEVATEMIISSDNTATNLIIDLLGGTERLNQQFQAWGLESTVLRNLLPDLDGTNTTSSADLVKLMALVDQGALLGLRSRDRLFSIMQRTYNRTLIPDGLGDGEAVVFNKTGDIGAALGDIALIDAANGKRYLLGILVTRPHNDGRANELIRRVSGRIHEEMNQPVSPLGGGVPSASPSEPSQTEEAMPSEPDGETYTLPGTDSNATPDVPRG
ncbi:MAG: serine hydrolase [Leptolyngbya sp. SIO1E4]|nr:serine hydrolase [Leptolyngbya sp. SIO1E4]